MKAGGRAEAEGLAGVHVLADAAPRWKRDPVEQARAACAGGAAVVQLRAKHALDREVLAWGAQIRRLTRESGVLFFVNDRFDLALATEADGVHLGQRDLPPEALPQEARARLLVGCSSHTLAEARAAADVADYVAFGPVYATRSKDAPPAPRGMERLAAVVVAVAPRPVVAIGGIDVGNAAAVARAGAAAIAVISAVAGADDPLAATRALVRAFARAA